MTEARPLRVMVDMSITLLHHGHVRLLRAAKELGTVVVALTTCDEIKAHKGYVPELDYEARAEILLALRHVDEVVPSRWMLDDAFLDQHRIDLLVHGADNSNAIRPERLRILSRTPGISSSLLRARALESVASLLQRNQSE